LDASIVLSTYMEKLSIAMLEWLRANDATAEKLANTVENMSHVG